MGGMKGGAPFHAGTEEPGERRKKERKRASFEIPRSLGAGHPKPYLAQFGSSIIRGQTSQQKLPPPARPVEKYTFRYLCNNLDRISLLHLCK